MSARNTADRLLAALLIGLCAVLYLGGLGHLPLFGRDEALYAEAAREMLTSGDWVSPRINGVFFFEKPPLYYWMAALCYRVLGVSPFAARLPAALMAIGTILITTAVGARVWGRRAGLLAGLALATSLQMVMIGRMGIMDVPLTFMITLALLCYAYWQRRGGLLAPACFGLLVALAMLLKGLAGALAPAIALVHMLLFKLRPSRITIASIALSLLCFTAVVTPWFGAMSLRHGEGYASTLFLREHLARMARPMQGHGGSVFYYLLLIAVSFFPWVTFLPPAFLRRGPLADERAAFWRSLSIVWVLVVLVPFSLICTKLPGYVTPLFPPMALLVGVELDRRLRDPGRGPWIGVIALGCFLGVLFALLPVAGAKLGERIGVSRQAGALVLPTAFWVAGYAAILVGGVEALRRAPRRGLGFMVAGQVGVLGALLIGMLPVLSPYLGGGPAYLAEIAAREVPNSRVILYETRPEGVAFVLGETIPVFSHNERDKLVAELRKGPSALIAPLRERGFWQSLPYIQLWARGGEVLLDVPRLTEGSEPDRAEDSEAPRY